MGTFHVCCAGAGAIGGALTGALLGGAAGGLVSLPLVPFTLGLALPILSSIGAVCGSICGAFFLGAFALGAGAIASAGDGTARAWLVRLARQLGGATGEQVRLTVGRRVAKERSCAADFSSSDSPQASKAGQDGRSASAAEGPR